MIIKSRPVRYWRDWFKSEAMPVRHKDGGLVVECPECGHRTLFCRNLSASGKEVYTCLLDFCRKEFVSAAGLHIHPHVGQAPPVRRRSPDRVTCAHVSGHIFEPCQGDACWVLGHTANHPGEHCHVKTGQVNLMGVPELCECEPRWKS